MVVHSILCWSKMKDTARREESRATYEVKEGDGAIKWSVLASHCTRQRHSRIAWNIHPFLVINRHNIYINIYLRTRIGSRLGTSTSIPSPSPSPAPAPAPAGTSPFKLGAISMSLYHMEGDLMRKVVQADRDSRFFSCFDCSSLTYVRAHFVGQKRLGGEKMNLVTELTHYSHNLDSNPSRKPER